MKSILASCVGFVSMIGAGTVLVACAAGEAVDSEAPGLDPNGLEESQVITSVNADGTWTANALTPVKPGYEVSAVATFTGPPGKTRRMGVCALLRGSAGAGTTCNTVADCSGAPALLPAGGFRYCVAPNGTGTKKCFYRPGPPAQYCTGTPAMAGNPPIAPGTFYTPSTSYTGLWISYACFEGCAATDPSSSSAMLLFGEPACGGLGNPCP
jgi:hypothetical protein